MSQSCDRLVGLIIICRNTYNAQQHAHTYRTFPQYYFSPLHFNIYKIRSSRFNGLNLNTLYTIISVHIKQHSTPL